MAGGKLREIERLRGAAVLMVVSSHWACAKALLPPPAQHAWTGVDLFFVISGYVVASSLLRSLPPLAAAPSFIEAFAEARDALRRFYARRFFRIVPAALAFMLVMRLGIGRFDACGTSPRWTAEVLSFAAGAYSYLRVYDHGGSLIFIHYWSLTVEEHFYLLLPVVFLLSRTPGGRLAACATIAVGSVALRLVPPPEGVEAHNYFVCASHLRFATLMAGVALALLPRPPLLTPVIPPAAMRYGILPVCVLLVACLPGILPLQVMLGQGHLLAALLSALLVHFASLDRGDVFDVPGLRHVLEYAGSRSYAIYLTHQAVERIESEVRESSPRYAALLPAGDDAPWRRLLLLATLSVLLAELLYQVIERPFIEMGRRLTERSREGAGAPRLDPAPEPALAPSRTQEGAST